MIFLCASLIYFVWDIWHVDYDDWFVLIEDSEIAIFCAWLPCSFEVLACWLYWLPILFRSVYWFWYLPWLFWSPCMYGFVVGLIWHVDSLACILSWSSFEHDVHIAIHPDSCSFLCGHEWYILYSAWLYDAWLPSLYMIACCLSMWVSLLSPYFQLSWCQSFLSSRFSLLQVWDLLCACVLTEPEIRSRV